VTIVGGPDLVLLVICFLVAVYLFFALVRPEKF
jgi:K+-transporting ATPase KdpF subunit